MKLTRDSIGKIQVGDRVSVDGYEGTVTDVHEPTWLDFKTKAYKTELSGCDVRFDRTEPYTNGLIPSHYHPIERIETPFASHLIYTQILDDKAPEQRKLGIALGEPWRKASDYTVFYIDYGMSEGMMKALQLCQDKRIKMEYRKIGRNKETNP